MEKVVNKEIGEYLIKYRSDIIDKVVELKINKDDEKIIKLLDFVLGYTNLVLTKDDLKKTTRLKTIIPSSIRCSAKRVNGEQCTRRKNKSGEYCGTHAKVLPYGVFEISNDNDESKKSLNVVAENIRGIMYYIDEYLNVYNTEDIVNGNEDPRIVARAVKINNVYSIPELGI
jgi:hypothetical protein